MSDFDPFADGLATPDETGFNPFSEGMAVEESALNQAQKAADRAKAVQAPYEAFKANYIKDAQKGIGARVVDNLTNNLGAAGSLIKTGLGGIGGAVDLVRNSKGPLDFAGNLLQTGTEALTRNMYDTVNAVRQKGSEYIDNPAQAFKDLRKGQALQTFGLSEVPGIVKNIVSPSAPVTPDDKEIRKAFEREQTNAAWRERREEGDLAPKLTGKANDKLAEAGSLVADPLNLVAGLGLAKAGMKMGLASMTKREAQLMTALSPGVRKAFNANAIKSIKLLAPDIENVAKEAGIKWDTAAGAADLGHYGKQSVWQKIDALNNQGGGPPIALDPSVSARQALSVVAGSSNEAKALRRQFGDKIGAIKDDLAPFLSGQMTTAEMEANLQVLNARNLAAEAATGVDKAKAMKADPALAVRMKLADGLRQQLDGALEGYGDLKKQYGAWHNFTDLAERQAIRQAKLDGNLSLYEGISYAPAIWQALAGKPLQAAGQLIGGKYAAYRRTPDYAFKKAASPYHALRDSNALRTGATVLATIGGKSYVVTYMNALSGEKAKVRLADGSVRSIDNFDLAPAPKPIPSPRPPASSSEEQP